VHCSPLSTELSTLSRLGSEGVQDCSVPEEDGSRYETHPSGGGVRTMEVSGPSALLYPATPYTWTKLCTELCTFTKLLGARRTGCLLGDLVRELQERSQHALASGTLKNHRRCCAPRTHEPSWTPQARLDGDKTPSWDEDKMHRATFPWEVGGLCARLVSCWFVNHWNITEDLCRTEPYSFQIMPQSRVEQK
jgi:hypothetical protein